MVWSAEVRDWAVRKPGPLASSSCLVEDGGGVAEDEVDAAGDEALEVVLAAVVGEKGVLVAEEADVLEDGAVGADGGGDGLAGGWPRRWAVFSMVRLSASKPSPSISAVSVKKVPPACLALRELVMTVSSGVGSEADEGDVLVVLRDVDALVVGAGFDGDDDAVAGGGEGVVVEGVLDGGELGGAVDAGGDEGETRTWTS